MKRIATVQDISCVGKCSLTVALPIISAMGIETAVIPTAVLSTHTAFQGFTFRDLTDDIQEISDHWLSQNFQFDGLYTGYLGSIRQLDLMSALFDRFGNSDNFTLVDPVMADNGQLYAGFTPEFVEHMTKLCGKADIIVPNMTETAFMLKTDYVDSGYDEAYIRDLLRQLTGLGARCAIITGVSFEPGKLGVMSYDADSGKYYSYFRERIEKSYHGTGDVFASCLTGALVRGNTLENALRIAVDYTVECIRITATTPDSMWYGVEFEKAMPYLLQRCGLIK